MSETLNFESIYWDLYPALEEAYNRQTDEWVWMDLTFYLLGANIGNVGPLNLAELYLYPNRPNRMRQLQLVEYNPKTGKVQGLPILESTKRANLFNYYKQDQEFHYMPQVPHNKLQ